MGHKMGHENRTVGGVVQAPGEIVDESQLERRHGVPEHVKWI